MSNQQFRILLWAMVRLAHCLRYLQSGDARLTQKVNEFDDDVRKMLIVQGIQPIIPGEEIRTV